MPGGTDTTLPSAGASTSEGSAAETTWARIAAAAERLGVNSVTRATQRMQPGDSAEDTSVVLERIEAQTRQSVASFETLDTLGQGGMGIVFRARQAALEREVALKKLNTDDVDLHPVFLSEAQVMGRLEHANVPPVHSLTHDEHGVPVLAMKLVRGAAWSALIGAGELLLADHVRLLLRVCDAVAFAHSRGIIHRDLKPDNVMVGDFGEVYVVDWGVAAAIDDDVSATSAILHVRHMPGPIGTPRYMAPELARGDAGEQDARTDVYLLGACLHEVLTGKPLHPGETVAAIRVQALASEPPVLDDAPRELAAACRRATAKRPEHRFQSVTELARALQAYLDHREALALLDTGERLVGSIAAADSPHEAQRLYHEAAFAFRRAQEIWPAADEPRAALDALHDRMLGRAIEAEDVALARRILAEIPHSPKSADVDDLERRLVARARELAELRADERRRSWQPVAGPLSAVFMSAGVAGAIGSVLTARWGTHRVAVMAMWMSITALMGLFARVRLARVNIPDHLASWRMFATWAAVALCIAIFGTVEFARGFAPFTDAHGVAGMLAIGFVATAVQTRKWLLLPAAAWFVGSLAIAFSPAARIPLFGALWLVTLGGVGVALARGVRLDPERPDDGRP